MLSKDKYSLFCPGEEVERAGGIPCSPWGRGSLSDSPGNPGVLSPPFPQHVQFRLGRDDLWQGMPSEEGTARVICQGCLCLQGRRQQHKRQGSSAACSAQAARL